KPIFDKQKELDRQQIVNSLKELGSQVKELEQSIHKDAGKESSDGKMGNDFSKGVDSAVSIITGIITGDITGGLAGASAPWIAEQIKLHTGHPDEKGNWHTDDVAGNLIAHAILGAVVAELQGNSGLAGGAGAVTGELAAKIIREQLYDKEVKDLTEAEKENISALAQLATGLAVASVGGDVGDVSTGIAAGKNAVENNSSGMIAWEHEIQLNEQLQLLELFNGDSKKVLSYIKGEGRGKLDGFADGVSNTLSSIGDTILHPEDTVINMYEVVTNLDKVYDKIKISATEWQELYEFSLENDPESAGYMIGYLNGRVVSEISSGFILGQGASKVIQKVAALKNIKNIAKGDKPLSNAGKGTALPNGYTPQGNNVVGPKGGIYTNTGKVDAAGNPIYTNNGAYYTFENGAKTKVSSPNTNISSQVQQNNQQGKKFEKSYYDEYKRDKVESAREVTIKTENGTKVRLDMIGKDKNGNITCIECKSSDKAPLTPNQKVGFPDLEKNGGTIIGDGKPGFEGGTKIPPTKVEVVRPDN
ncbi:VENN motif pre-toxin domain-containing protein, partial [Gilliamella sp. G0441]|uniref:VENN motif pre-toxin domain-containing protein n=1 Tax=Gilliamella sp. G0441 TaxID=3384760 RepID=UPI003D34B75B